MILSEIMIGRFLRNYVEFISNINNKIKEGKEEQKSSFMDSYIEGLSDEEKYNQIKIYEIMLDISSLFVGLSLIDDDIEDFFKYLKRLHGKDIVESSYYKPENVLYVYNTIPSHSGKGNYEVTVYYDQEGLKIKLIDRKGNFRLSFSFDSLLSYLTNYSKLHKFESVIVNPKASKIDNTSSDEILRKKLEDIDYTVYEGKTKGFKSTKEILDALEGLSDSEKIKVLLKNRDVNFTTFKLDKDMIEGVINRRSILDVPHGIREVIPDKTTKAKSVTNVIAFNNYLKTNYYKSIASYLDQEVYGLYTSFDDIVGSLRDYTRLSKTLMTAKINYIKYMILNIVGPSTKTFGHNGVYLSFKAVKDALLKGHWFFISDTEIKLFSEYFDKGSIVVEVDAIINSLDNYLNYEERRIHHGKGLK